MKKGFTLVELLVTMVLVVILSTVAVMKYKGTLERGRAAQAFAVLRDVSDAMNTQFALQGGVSYPNLANVHVDSLRIDKYFSAPSAELSNFGGQTLNEAIISISRLPSDRYTLQAINRNGDLIQIRCIASDIEECKAIGMRCEGSLCLLE